MASVVTAVPKATRETKYDYDTLLNGEIHRLVQGEDFTSTLESFRGALYNKKALINSASPEAQIGVSVKFRTNEGPALVAYVQKVPAKAKPAAKKAPAKPVVKKAAAPAKPAGKTVAPSPKA